MLKILWLCFFGHSVYNFVSYDTTPRENGCGCHHETFSIDGRWLWDNAVMAAPCNGARDEVCCVWQWHQLLSLFALSTKYTNP